MRAPGMIALAAALGAMVFAPSDARAGSTSPVSSIAALPGPVAFKVTSALTPIPGLTMKTKNGERTPWHELSASTGRGYCLAQKEAGHNWLASYQSSGAAATEDLDLDRLTEKDGTVTFERTRVHFDPPSGTITATGRSQVVLKEIARSPAGVVVWAYREGRAVVILAKHVERGVESREVASEDSSIPFVSSDGCPFAGARLDVQKPEAGASVQLTGSLPAPGTGKDKVIAKFIIDASVSRVARDPEPLLAVRVRMQD